MLVHFTTKELQCPASGEVRMAPGFGEKLEQLRTAFGHPMLVNSCCRSTAYNAKIGGHPRSFHVYDFPYHPTGGTCAIDIATQHMESHLRERLIFTACQLGWSIGLGNTFLHLDRRVDYTDFSQALFGYSSP